MVKSIRILSILLIAVSLSSCSWYSGEKREKTGLHYYLAGLDHYNDGHYTDAILSFEKVRDDFPFSKFAILAELKIAECYFFGDKYLEALIHLQGFQDLHPANINIPYVIYLKGTAYEKEALTIDRDPTNSEKAIKEFEDLIFQHPSSPYAKKAKGKLLEVKGNMARANFYVGRFYYRDGNFPAAVRRFEIVHRDYPGTGLDDRTLYYLGKCHFFMDKDDESRRYFDTLLEDHPDSAYAPNAKPFLNDLAGTKYVTISKYRRLKERILGYFYFE